MKTAIITVGVSASGKSTLAKYLIENREEDEDFVEINRDNIRFSEIDPGGDWSTYIFNDENEIAVTKIFKQQLLNAVQQNKSVILSNTNLNRKNYKRDLDVLISNGYNVAFVVLNIPLDVCIKRDASRGKMSVGEDVIRKQYEKFLVWLDNSKSIKYPITMLTF